MLKKLPYIALYITRCFLPCNVMSLDGDNHLAFQLIAYHRHDYHRWWRNTSFHHHQRNPVTLEPEEPGDGSNDTHLLSLPLLVLTNIIDDLDVSDVCSLRLVNKFLLKVTETSYIHRVRLSGSPISDPASSPASPCPRTPSLSVLDLAVTYNLSQLPTGQQINSFIL